MPFSSSVRRQKPLPTLGINWSHPRTRGLYTYIDARTGRDLVRNMPATTNTGTVIRHSFGRGAVPVLTFAGSSGILTAPVNIPSTLARTYCIWTYRVGNGGANFGRIWHLGAADIFTAFNYDTTNYAIYRSASEANVQQCTFPRPSSLTWAHIGVSHNGTTAIPEAYVNGLPVVVTEVVGIAGACIATDEIINIGNRGTADRGWDGHLGDLSGWTRILTPQEHFQQYLQSWEILQMQQGNVRMGEVAAAPGFDGSHSMWHVFL
jgi:hypothetical protein